MSSDSKNILKTLTREEPFITGRRSCKGCGKALAARLVSKAVADTALLPGGSMPQYPASPSAQAYDSVSTSAMINDLLLMNFSIFIVVGSVERRSFNASIIIKSIRVGLSSFSV